MMISHWNLWIKPQSYCIWDGFSRFCLGFGGFTVHGFSLNSWPCWCFGHDFFAGIKWNLKSMIFGGLATLGWGFREGVPCAHRYTTYDGCENHAADGLVGFFYANCSWWFCLKLEKLEETSTNEQGFKILTLILGGHFRISQLLDCDSPWKLDSMDADSILSHFLEKVSIIEPKQKSSTSKNQLPSGKLT